MSCQLHFGPDDLLRCRFAVSPLWETQEAVRTLARPERYGYHQPWLRRVRRSAQGLDLRPLWLLMRQRGHTPDFFCLPPLGPAPSFAEEIARVRKTPAQDAHRDLSLALADTADGPESAAGRAMLDEPEQAVRELADLLEQTWHELLEPEWPRLRALLEADVAYHSLRLAHHGFEQVVAELSPQLSWSGSTLTVDGTAGSHERLLDGQGLVLMPSVFAWPQVASGYEPPWQPAVVYPARGIGDWWTSVRDSGPEALGKLLGRARARVLCALDEPAGTSVLAGRLGLAPSSVSEHLGVLRSAGLLTSRRYGHQVLYERTPLGIALASEGSSETDEP